MIEVTRKQTQIPTYPPKPAHELPMFFEHKPYQGASGRLYPIPYSDGITDAKSDATYTVYELENEYVRTVLLPEIGGKILRAYDKIGQYDFVYYNEVVKPALVGLAGAWISGGIEFNWPQHHRPTTFLPTESAVTTAPDGTKTVWMGEVDPLYRMKGMVGISLAEGRSYIRADVRVYNRTPQPQTFMWWANLAAPANDQYRTIFPPDVEWVNDHDRRAVLQWPIAKGVYRTARPFNFGDGTDISRYDAIKVPSSYLVSQGQSDMDFVAGYDEGRQMGVATVANHHVSPGKKMWHWGKGDFGAMWCANLTDENGPYIELMTGVYTDNQPDFTWLAPYETRTFTQYWYPIRGLGGVKNATIDGAMNFTLDPENSRIVRLAFLATGQFPGAHIRVTAHGQTLLDQPVDATPDAPVTAEFDRGDVDEHDLTAALVAADGRVLVAYRPVRRGKKQPIAVREPVRTPAEIATVEELYLNGLHLEQYKQHNFDPADYYREGLRRDPDDARCNTGLARLALRDGRFDDCVAYADAAIRRLTARNEHPADTEAFYLKGAAQLYAGDGDGAYDTLYRAAWQYAYRSASMYLLALIDCRRGDFADAMEKLDESDHPLARDVQTAIRRRLSCPDAAQSAAQAFADDPLDCFAVAEAQFAGLDGAADAMVQFAAKPENRLDVARTYLTAGWADDALRLLADADDPLSHYYKAYALRQLGRDPAAEWAAAESCGTGTCFPSQPEDIAVLQAAIDGCGGANASYYLGCLYFDRRRYAEAAACFESCVQRDPAHAKAYRNLALLYFDHRHDAAAARMCMARALTLRDDPRLLLEYQQLLKASGAPTAERLAVYDRYPALLAARDDCCLDRMVLLCMDGRYAEAIAAAKAKHFHIYEGGEGKLTRQHAWMHVLYAMAEWGDPAHASALLHDAQIIPKSYGEAKTYFNQEAHIFYLIGQLAALRGDDDAARAAYETASVDKSTVSELSMFRALALRQLLRFADADAVLREMIARADDLQSHLDRRTYYGVGSPSPMPFEDDIRKQNGVESHVLRAFALLGQGNRLDADREINAAAALDPNEFRVYAYRKVAAWMGER